MRSWEKLRSWTSSPTARAVLVALLTSLPLAVAVAVLPRLGGDVVAQRWWASWAEQQGSQPVDFGWYAGLASTSYSLASPWMVAWFGVAVCGVLGTVGGTAAMGVLLARCDVRRPLAATAVTAPFFAADQLSGRITFGLGAAAGVAAVALLTASPSHRWRRPATAAVAALAGSLSPVASALLLLAGAAWWLADRRAPGRLADAVWLVVGALLPLGAMTLLGGAQGQMTASPEQTLSMALALVVLAASVGARQRLAWVGALLGLLALAAVWVLPDPVGSNVTRLVLLFGVPVLVAVSPRSPVQVGLVAALVVWLMPPVVPADLIETRSPVAVARASGLLAELERRSPVGRIEVVPLNSHLEAQVVSDEFPIARGWLRQVDVPRNELFYDGTLDESSYHAWLLDRGVSYVALPAARADWSGRPEARLVRSGLPYLQEVWADEDWTLYTVDGGELVDGDAELLASDRRGIELDVRSSGPVEVALYWNRSLTLSGPDGCLAPGSRDGTVTLEARTPGTYRISSAWTPSGHC